MSEKSPIGSYTVALPYRDNMTGSVAVGTVVQLPEETAARNPKRWILLTPAKTEEAPAKAEDTIPKPVKGREAPPKPPNG